MNRKRRRCAGTVLAKALALMWGVGGAWMGGCASNEPVLTEQWSTKNDSVIESDRPSLAISNPSRNERGEPEAAGTSFGELRSWKSSAVELLKQAAGSSDAMVRANALEALHAVPAAASEVARSALGDPNRGVRYVAAMTVGKLKLTDIAPLVEPLLHDESDSVRAAAIFALYRCGREVDLTPLSAMLGSQKPETRANAAFVLGELGNRSATPLIEEAMRRGMPRVEVNRAKLVDLQMAEAMVKLGRDDMLEGIRAALYSPGEMGELAALAAQICGELNDQRSAAYLLEIANRSGERASSAEIRLAATAAVARMGMPQVPNGVAEAYVTSERPELRAQAAMTLGVIGDEAGMGHLVRLMKDRDSMVQVAAAGGILRLREG